MLCEAIDPRHPTERSDRETPMWLSDGRVIDRKGIRSEKGARGYRMYFESLH